MGISTLGRDYDIARILADHERRISLLERRVRALGDGLDSYRIVQGSDQNVISSTTPVNSSIVIPVSGTMRIDLEMRYQTGTAGGGIRWQWASSGTVNLDARSIGAAGSATSGSTTNTADIYWRNFFSLTGLVQIAQFNNSATNRGSEVLIVNGSGTLTLQFAQNASVAVNTTLFADSYAMITRLPS